MATKAPREDFDDTEIAIEKRKQYAGGVPAVLKALDYSNEQMGAVRTGRTLLRLNQKHGFDCPGCAWPDPKDRSPAEFCENGAKAVAEEATLRRVTPEFFAAHSLTELEQKTDWWLGQQGRITHPVIRREGSDHYEEIGWDEAFRTIADELRALPSADDAVFYTSGRTSNEAAFLWQLLVRGYGTNNLPDCSNMCHESSGSALGETIGVGKGSVSLEDIHEADLLVVTGQNPGTNHPRMLTALQKAKRNGAVIVSVNPLPEAGLIKFKNPQSPVNVVTGTELSDDFLQIRVGGDMALFQAVGRLLLDKEAAAPGTVLDRAFLDEHTIGVEDYRGQVEALDWDDVLAATGLTRAEIEGLATRFANSKKTIVCWAMGLTQHKHSVKTLREVVNVLLLQGNIGRPGAGVCPVRGHSNVQGDRTMGIFERMPTSFHDALDREFAFTSPREHGFDTVAAIEAMRDQRARFFMGMGGNFVRATPDTDVTEAALRSCSMTVQVSTKLNRSHVVAGRTALILPTLGRTERDVQRGGEQVVTVEDSMSAVHSSKGRLAPASAHLLSEVAIVCRLARELLGSTLAADWQGFEDDYSTIRARIARVVPGFEDYETKIAQPGGFVLPHAAAQRRWNTETGKATFTANELEYPHVPEGRLLMQTLRSHDQFNTTIYGLDDRYRGIKDGRRVVFVHPDDITQHGLVDGQHVDLVSEYDDGERVAENFRVVAYSTARGCVASYYPETNVLVPLGHKADISGTPASKSIVVRLVPRADAPVPASVLEQQPVAVR